MNLDTREERSIRPLPLQLANQIAAGEVVERPASVVKELVENSLDAGASEVEITINGGGISLIRVTDNGCGIRRDELTTALAPHATSKVYTQQELEGVNSLGFRGEALASIASVSRLTLTSRHHQSEHGWSLTTGGEPEPAPLSGGSVVEVSELFFNTPARKRFLRSERTEFLQVEEVVRRLALSHFAVSFRFSHNGREQLRLPRVEGEVPRAEGCMQRIKKLFGKDFSLQAQRVEISRSGMRLCGWISPPGFSLPLNDKQYFYLNGRMMRDKVIRHALKMVWHDQLETGRHPAWILFLEIDPHQVDVNVHPTKHEVRFRQGRVVHDFLLSALRQRLESVQGEEGESARFAQMSETTPDTATLPDAVAERTIPFRASGQGSGGGRGGGGSRGRSEGSWSLLEALERSGDPTLSAKGECASVAVAAEVDAAMQKVKIEAALFHRFLLLHWEEQAWLLDLGSYWRQALQQRFLHRHQQQQEVKSRPLLLPQLFALSPSEADRCQPQLDTLQQLGFGVERQGEESLLLRHLPLELTTADHQGLLQQVMAAVLQEESPGVERLIVLLTDHCRLRQLPRSGEDLGYFLGQYGGESLQQLSHTPWMVVTGEQQFATLFRP
ncbi:MAG: DNA mismatch repair endonuclease MutL [Gammaproteobacteria bacterium]|nr:DNA mismatch repair endonuclease MutL [Gammaproteobacteria bacterium]